MKKIILFVTAIMPFTCLSNDIFLLRHAEKLKGSDPELSVEGKKRAIRIAEKLTPYKPTLILSSNYKRTIQTATPLASRLGLDIKLYNPRDNRIVFESIKNNKGPIVIFGHSNTIPLLVNELSGSDVLISENEFSKVFKVSDGKLTILDSN